MRDEEKLGGVIDKSMKEAFGLIVSN